MQNLKFLDSSPVTANEKKEALRVGKFSNIVARPDPTQYQKKIDDGTDTIKALPSDLRPIEAPGGASFGTNKYVSLRPMRENYNLDTMLIFPPQF